MGVARILKVVVVLVCVLSAKLSWAATLPAVEILNRAAEQRTLVMSIAKHYVLAAANVDVRASQAAQANDMKRFESNLHALRLNAPNTFARNALKDLTQDWESYLALLDQEANNANIEAVIEASNKLVFTSDLVISKWKGIGSDRELEALNLSHHQAMVSERISLLYAAHYYGLKDDWIVMELNEAMHEYEKSLAFLKRFIADDKAMAEHLQHVDNQWTYAKQGFAKFNQGHYLPKVIAVTMGSMQQQMDQVAQYYTETHVSQQPSFTSLSVPGLAANIE